MAPPVSMPASNSLWSPLDTVKDAAESLGIANLPNDVGNVVAMDVEYRIFQITEQALKFMRHSKRKTLLTKDINKALKVLNVEPLYGYGNNISNGNGKPLSFKQALVGPGQTLYYLDENQMDFEKLINTPLPKIPRLVTFTAHWLAIEGVQPNIPQNPSLNEIKSLPANERGSMQNLIINTNSISEESAKNSTSNGPSGNRNGKFDTNNNGLSAKPLIKHVISKELQLYFNKIISVLTSSPVNNPEYEYLKNAALVSMRSDPGLHQLVPYFIQFISETITNNLNDISLLHIMLESIYSLLLNENIFLDPYIHALLPCILTLLLAKKIGKLPTSANQIKVVEANTLEDYLDETLAIREFAASLLDHILKNYGSNYNTLKPRVARTLLKAFLQSSLNGNNNDVNETKEEETSSIDKTNIQKLYMKNLLRNFGCYYGAIIGIKKLGNEIIRLVLLGNLKIWSEFIFFDTTLDIKSENNNDDGDVEMADNESNETADTNNDVLSNKIFTREKKVLTGTIISVLKELKKDGKTLKKEGSDEPKKEVSADRVKETVGAGFYEALRNESDYDDIVDGVFFGEN
ncbi:TATA-binding protein-associated factor [Saccharomycopsis crataegensis]|uniref:TBP-associated factor 6 n=1 Tax=Saccharomycopsis crataegensis TaxID=43959 RepID=A0AAV5QMJ1_9ASCO|nr:TATA-binding protein-associated factor [Saccharomycopsis crataegensis]